MLWFLDPAFEVSGIVVETARSKTRAYPSIFAWSPEDRRWYSETILRDCGVEIVLVDEEGGKMFAPQSNPKLPQIELPMMFLEGPLRIRLLTEGGTTEPLESYVRYSTDADTPSTTVSVDQ